MIDQWYYALYNLLIYVFECTLKSLPLVDIFSLFVFSTSVYSLYCAVISFVVLLMEYVNRFDFNIRHGDIWKVIKECPFVFGVGLYSFFICLSISSLSCYHCCLICNGETTNENVKDTFRVSGNPYDEGCRRNCKAVYCAKHVRSQIVAKNVFSLYDNARSLTKGNDAIQCK